MTLLSKDRRSVAEKAKMALWGLEQWILTADGPPKVSAIIFYMPQAVFEWEGQEYEHNPKSADWYWAIGIIATTAAIASLLFANYLLALLIIIAAITLALHAAKKPVVHHFKLTDRGLLIDTSLHPYEHMRTFSVFEYIEVDKPPVLSIHTESWFFPHLLIPLIEVDADAVYLYLLEHIDEAEHHHTLSDLVAAWLGF